MNKAFFIILVALTIIAVNSEFHLCQDFKFDVVGSNDTDDLADYCRILSTSLDKTHCCYIEDDNGAYCGEISDDAYENIKRYKKFKKNTNSHYKIKCSSEYLSYSLLALLALLF